MKKAILPGEEEVVHAFNAPDMRETAQKKSAMQITGAPPAKSKRKTWCEFKYLITRPEAVAAASLLTFILHSKNTYLLSYNNYSFLCAHILNNLVLILW